jgi:hypothetical protein
VGAVLGLSEGESSPLLKVMAGEGVESLPTHVDEGEATEEAAHFCNQWLACIGRGTTGALLAKILSVERLSPRAAKQLEMDTTYLTNVFINLEVRPPPVLEHLRYLVGCPEGELEARLAAEGAAAHTKGTDIVLKKIEKKIAAARGLIVAF